jgi:hypothetical protein
MIIIEGTQAINQYRMLAAVKMLELEAKTGMINSRGSVLKMVQREYGIKARTKSAAAVELRAKLDAQR